MRILHVITSLYTGGAERLMVDLLPRLCNNGKNQVDILLINGVKTPFKTIIQERGIRVFALSSTNDVYHPRNIIRMRPYLAKYDVIHTHNTACQLFVPLALSFSSTHPVLVTTEHNANNRRRQNRWLKPVDRWMYKRYDAIICIADQTRQNLEEYLGKQNKIHTIYNGIDINRFVRPINDITGKDHFVITMVSTYRVQKDHETLMRAMKHLPEMFRLQFVGGGEKEDEHRLRSYCHHLELDDRIYFMGVRNDVPEILEQSDFVVLSSHWEGLSLSSVEGMASGRPFIASDVDGLREIVGGAGLLFAHEDDVELANIIKRLSENPDEYKSVAQRCQERARQYDISKMAENYLNLYNSLISRKN